MDQDVTWCGDRTRPKRHCYKGIQLPSQKGAESPFSAHVYCDQTAAWIKMPLDMEVGLGPGYIVLDGDPDCLPKLSAHVCCGQTGGWIKMPLGTKVVLGRGHIVLEGNPATPPRKGPSRPTLFGPCLLWPNGRSSQELVSFC